MNPVWTWWGRQVCWRHAWWRRMWQSNCGGRMKTMGRQSLWSNGSWMRLGGWKYWEMYTVWWGLMRSDDVWCSGSCSLWMFMAFLGQGTLKGCSDGGGVFPDFWMRSRSSKCSNSGQKGLWLTNFPPARHKIPGDFGETFSSGNSILQLCPQNLAQNLALFPSNMWGYTAKDAKLLGPEETLSGSNHFMSRWSWFPPFRSF